ncbi:MAG: carbamoyl phosphate synthase large subunit, partial [Nitrososphaerota archaeon]
ILVYPDSTRTVAKFETVVEVLQAAGYEVLTLEEMPIPGVPEIRSEAAVKAIKMRRIGMLASTGYIPQIDYEIRRAAADHNIPLVLNTELAQELSIAFKRLSEGVLDMSVMEMGELWGINRQRIAPLLMERKRETGIQG